MQTPVRLGTEISIRKLQGSVTATTLSKVLQQNIHSSIETSITSDEVEFVSCNLPSQPNNQSITNLPKTLFTCHLCGVKLCSFHNLEEHNRAIHPNIVKTVLEKDWKCIYCSQQFECSSLRVQHVKNEHPESRYCCRLCPKDFAAKSDRLRHEMRTHGTNVNKPDMIVRCSKCNKPFSSKKCMLNHIEKFHPELLVRPR